MLEVLGALAVGLVLIAGGAGLYSWYSQRTLDQANADWMTTWRSAATKYMSDNQSSLVSSGGAWLTMSQIQAAGSGYFPVGAAPSSPTGMTAVLRVTIQSGTAEGMVCANGGSVISDIDRQRIAGFMGKGGGYVLSTSNGNAQGRMWGPVALSSYGLSAGACQLVDALFVGAAAAATDDSLHRHSTAGQPQLNQMATAIDMSNNDINNAGNVTARTATFPSGGNAINIGGSYLYGDSSNLALRAASGNVYIQNPWGSASGSIVQVHNVIGDGSSIFTAYNMSAANGLWAGNYVNTTGTMQANGSIYSGGDVVANGAVYASNWLRTYGNTGWYSQTYGGGWYMQDSTWIRAYNDKNIYTAGEIRGGLIHSTGNVVADGVIQVNARYGIGSGCSGSQLAQANDGTGQFIMCKNGVWTAMGGGYSSFVQATGTATNGFNTSFAYCPAGYVVLSGTALVTYNGISTNPAFTTGYQGTTGYYARSNDSRVWGEAIAYCAK